MKALEKPFQSTLPSQGATEVVAVLCRLVYISIHAPLTGSDENAVRSYNAMFAISIHAPLTGSDEWKPKYVIWENVFQSTLPSQGATLTHHAFHLLAGISIHAPLTGSDVGHRTFRKDLGDFNPRSPHRERRFTKFLDILDSHFNPRSPHRERPMRPRQPLQHNKYFNPRSPHRERRVQSLRLFVPRDISIHAPLTGSDGHRTFRKEFSNYFNPRSPHRERPLNTY